MQILHTQTANVVTIQFVGELDEHTSKSAREELESILDKSSAGSRIIYDFKRLEFMDSTGIGVIIGRYKKYANKGLEFYILSPNRTIDRILKMTGIYSLIKLAG